MADLPLDNRLGSNLDAPSARRWPGESGNPDSSFPDLETLTAGLNAVLLGPESSGRVTVLSRDSNPGTGKRSPCEIVTVRMADGARRLVFCKYGGYDWHSHGLWGVAYEVEVYREILSTVDTTTPRFFGAVAAGAPEKVWLVLEYLDDCEQLSHAPQPMAMIETARWLARFHAATEELLSKREMPFLRIHDFAYYRAWSTRILEFAASQPHQLTWLAPLCRRWEELAQALLVPPTTIIHGDFYGSNTLMRDGVPHVIDWESAAASVGEIDLAFQIEGWPEEIAKSGQAAYQETRWPLNPPPEFSQRLEAARLYQHLRWLGDHPEWTSAKGLQRLHAVATQLGVI